MNSIPFKAHGGPVRDFVGYGRTTPEVQWPDGSAVAVNLVLNYEEGAEYSLLDGDEINDTWGEYSYQIPPDVRDLGTEMHMEYGSRVGVWRLARMFDEYGIDISVDAPAVALERNPEFCDWIRGSSHDVIGHGYRWTEDSRMTRDEERAYLRLAVRVDRADDRPAGRGLDRALVPERQHARAAGRARRVPLRLGLDERRASVLRHDSRKAVPGAARTPRSTTTSRYLIAPTYATPRHFFENLKLGLDYMVEEADQGSRRPHDVGRAPRPLERTGEPRHSGAGLHRVRAREGRRLLHAPPRHRPALAREPPPGGVAAMGVESMPQQTAGCEAGSPSSPGGSSGIGRAICRLFAAEGADVVIADRTADVVEGGEPTSDLIAAEGGAATFVRADLGSSADIASLVDSVLDRHGRVDVLVNNAATYVGKPLLETTEEEWNRVFAVNVTGVFLLTKAVVAQMIQQEARDGVRGRIVNISSQHGMIAAPKDIAYGTSKSAIVYITRQIASRLRGGRDHLQRGRTGQDRDR